MSIASDLTAVATNLNSALEEINDKIEAKGGTASETVYGVAAAVENLPSGKASTIMATVPIRNIAVPDNIAVSFYTFQDFSEFTEVEYIGFTGTQELKTDFTLLETSKYEIDIDLADMCGTGISRYNLPENSSSVLSTRTSGKIIIGAATRVNNTGRGIFGQNYADGTATEYGIQYDDSINQNKPNAYPYVVGYWYEGGKKYYPITANLYGLKIWDNNILVRDFVPCYHTATGIIGMFDTVNNKFYMNAGTGTFLKGADI